VPVHQLSSEEFLCDCIASTLPSKCLMLQRSFRKVELVLCLSTNLLLLRSFMIAELVLQCAFQRPPIKEVLQESVASSVLSTDLLLERPVRIVELVLCLPKAFC
jgi:hypothetical protein